jgi:hypothetical protein
MEMMVSCSRHKRSPRPEKFVSKAAQKAGFAGYAGL